MRFKLTSKLNISLRKIPTRELMNIIAHNMQETVKDRFRTSSGPNGERWATVAYRNGKPLVITGSLRDSLKREYKQDIAIVGTNDIRARIHQYGGFIRAKNKPYLHFKINDKWVKTKSVYIRARPYVGFNEVMKKRYKEMITAHFKEHLKNKLGGN